MKKIIIPLLASACLFSACSEDLLDIEQKGVVTEEEFYKNDADAEAAMVAAYQGFLWNITTMTGGSIYAPFRACFNLPGDDVYGAGEFFGDNDQLASMNEYRFDTGADVVTNCYSNIYYAMYYSNIVIDKFKNGETEVQKRCVAEARVLRAYLHMMLAIGWDVPPLVDHLLDSKENPFNCNTQAENPLTHEELLRWCAKECEEALPYLTERKSTTDKDGAYKATKGFANAVAGKCYLFVKDYANAKAALKKVIDSEKYALVSGENYWQNFHKEGDGNEEKVFEVNIMPTNGVPVWWDIINRSTWMEANCWNWRSDHFVLNPNSSRSSIDGWGGLGVPQWVADEFIKNEGGTETPRFKATFMNINDVVFDATYAPIEVPESDELAQYGTNTGKKNANDETLYSVDLAKVPMEALKASDDLGIGPKGLYGQSFYLPYKNIAKSTDLTNPGEACRINNYTIMRYAEVLLMYAEACIQTGDAATAGKYINMTKERAGAPLLNGAATMDDLKREKKVELWLEGCRWADLIRWGDLDGVKNAGKNVTQLYDKLTRKPEAGETITWENGSEANSRFYLVDSHVAIDRYGNDNVGFKEGKHEHFPFPNKCTSINPNLTQNQGW